MSLNEVPKMAAWYHRLTKCKRPTLRMQGVPSMYGKQRYSFNYSVTIDDSKGISIIPVLFKISDRCIL